MSFECTDPEVELEHTAPVIFHSSSQTRRSSSRPGGSWEEVERFHDDHTAAAASASASASASTSTGSAASGSSSPQSQSRGAQPCPHPHHSLQQQQQQQQALYSEPTASVPLMSDHPNPSPAPTRHHSVNSSYRAGVISSTPIEPSTPSVHPRSHEVSISLSRSGSRSRVGQQQQLQHQHQHKPSHKTSSGGGVNPASTTSRGGGNDSITSSGFPSHPTKSGGMSYPTSGPPASPPRDDSEIRREESQSEIDFDFNRGAAPRLLTADDEKYSSHFHAMPSGGGGRSRSTSSLDRNNRDGTLSSSNNDEVRNGSEEESGTHRSGCGGRCYQLVRWFSNLCGSEAADLNERYGRQFSLGERVADSVSLAVGSWRFVGTQSFLLSFWIVFNVVSSAGPDPFPFILLNLMLSFQAAYTAPIIMMSQNRQGDVDRLKAEDLHEKVDHIRLNQVFALWDQMVLQNSQIQQLKQQMQDLKQILQRMEEKMESQQDSANQIGNGNGNGNATGNGGRAAKEAAERSFGSTVGSNINTTAAPTS